MTNETRNKLERITRGFALAGLVALASGCGDRVIYEGNIRGKSVKLLKSSPFDIIPEKLEITTSNGTTYILEGNTTNDCLGYLFEINNGRKKVRHYYPTRTDEILKIWATYHQDIERKKYELEQEKIIQY